MERLPSPLQALLQPSASPSSTTATSEQVEHRYRQLLNSDIVKNSGYAKEVLDFLIRVQREGHTHGVGILDSQRRTALITSVVGAEEDEESRVVGQKVWSLWLLIAGDRNVVINSDRENGSRDKSRATPMLRDVAEMIGKWLMECVGRRDLVSILTEVCSLLRYLKNVAHWHGCEGWPMVSKFVKVTRLVAGDNEDALSEGEVQGLYDMYELLGETGLDCCRMDEVAECVCRINLLPNGQKMLWDAAIEAVRKILKSKWRFAFLEGILQVVNTEPDKGNRDVERESLESLLQRNARLENLRRTAVYYVSDTLWGTHRVLPLADEVDWAEPLDAFADALEHGGWHTAREIQLSILELIDKHGEGLSRTEWIALTVLLKKLKIKFDALVEHGQDFEIAGVNPVPPREALALGVANFQLSLFGLMETSAGVEDVEGAMRDVGKTSDDAGANRAIASTSEKARLEFATGWGAGLDYITDLYKDHLPTDKVIEVITLRSARIGPTPVLGTWIDSLQKIVTLYFLKEPRLPVQYKVLDIVRGALWSYPDLYADIVVHDILQTFSAEEEPDLQDEVVFALLRLYTDAACRLPLNPESVDIVISNICGVARAETGPQNHALAALQGLQDIFTTHMRTSRARVVVKAYNAMLGSDFLLASHKCCVQRETVKFFQRIYTTHLCTVRLRVTNEGPHRLAESKNKGDHDNQGTTETISKTEYVEAPSVRCRAWRFKKGTATAEKRSDPEVLNIHRAVEGLVSVVSTSKCRGVVHESSKSLLWITANPNLMHDVEVGDWVTKLLDGTFREWVKEWSPSVPKDVRTDHLDVLYQIHSLPGAPVHRIMWELLEDGRSSIKRLYQVTTILSQGVNNLAIDAFPLILDIAEHFILKRRGISSVHLEPVGSKGAQQEVTHFITSTRAQSEEHRWKKHSRWEADNLLTDVYLDAWDFASLECLCSIYPLLGGSREVGSWAQRTTELLIKAVNLGGTKTKRLMRGDVDGKRRWRQLAFYVCAEASCYLSADLRASLALRLADDARNHNSLAKAMIEHMTYFADSASDRPHDYRSKKPGPVFLARGGSFPAVITLKATSLPGISVCQHRATGNIRYAVSSSMMGAAGVQLERELRNAQLEKSKSLLGTEDDGSASKSEGVAKSAPNSPQLSVRESKPLNSTSRSSSFSEIFSLLPCTKHSDMNRDAFAGSVSLVSKLCFSGSHNIAHLKGNQDRIQRILSTLNTVEVTGTHSIGVAYVRRDNRSEREVFTNNAGCARFSEFLKNLGDVQGRTSASPVVYTSGFDRERKVFYQGPCFLHWRGPGRQIAFDAPSLMWNKYGDHEEDAHFAQKKKRQFGNDHVTIIFSDSGNVKDADVFETSFKTVRIIVSPASANLFSVNVVVTKPEQVKCADIPFFGPLYPRKEPHLVRKDALANAVRLTAMHADIACLSVGLPMQEINWECRAAMMEQLGKDTCVYREKKQNGTTSSDIVG